MAVDVILNAVIVSEVVLRIVAVSPKVRRCYIYCNRKVKQNVLSHCPLGPTSKNHPQRFFESWMNIVDVFIVLACIITMILEIVEVNNRGEEEVSRLISEAA